MKKKSTNKINAAVIGLGFGLVHAEIYKKNKECNLIYLCDFNWPELDSGYLSENY